VLSVILPTISGREESLSRAVASYEETLADYPGKWEIIVIKDYPTWPSACNEGYRKSKGSALKDVVHFTADDLEALPGWWIPALEHLERHNELPAPRVYDYNPPPLGEWANAVDGSDGEITRSGFTRIPIMTRKQYGLIGYWPHIDYYADVWVSKKGRSVGIETRNIHGYDFVHHWSQIGRVDDPPRLQAAWNEFNRLTKEMV
jgi:glycosyltransferase involved in cell wall biosynthesis